MLKVLQTLNENSLKVYEMAKDGQNGALSQNLSTLDWLLSTVEGLKKTLPKTHIRACVNLGRKKLDKYYGLSDATTACLPYSCIYASNNIGSNDIGQGRRPGSNVPTKSRTGRGKMKSGGGEMK